MLGLLIAINGRSRPDLVEDVVEVRVEQVVGQPTRYTVRFQADISDGDFEVASDGALNPRDSSPLPGSSGNQDNEITIAVPDPSGINPICLVHGPIEKRRLSVVDGGAGSMLEISGSDRRVVMDREHKQDRHRGLASTVVLTILAQYGLVPDVEPTEIMYDDRGQFLNQNETDFSFVTKLAKRNGFEFWVDCEAICSPGGGIKVVETGHFKTSPRQEQRGVPKPPKVSLSRLFGEVAIRLNQPKPADTTVRTFEVDSDGEVPTSVEGKRIADSGPKVKKGGVPGNPLSPQGEKGASTFAGERTQSIHLTTAGDAKEFKVRSEAALLEAGWFVRARATTTAHQLRGVIQPHQLVPVQGAGRAHDGTYFVESVVHTINGGAHNMAVGLKNNAVGV